MPKVKTGMYGETPQIKIGKFTISMMTDRENEENIWIDYEGEGAEFKAIHFEKAIEEVYKKYF